MLSVFRTDMAELAFLQQKQILAALNKIEMRLSRLESIIDATASNQTSIDNNR
jgi:hypothetical protein